MGARMTVPHGSAGLDLLVTAAYAPDLRGLRRYLGDGLDGNLANLHVAGKAIGIGMPVAGGSTAKRVFQLEPRAVVFVGTCGVYPGQGSYQPHDIVVAQSLKLVAPSVLSGRSAFPEPMQVELPVHRLLSAGLASAAGRAHHAVVGCPLAQTRDEQLAAQIPTALGVQVENLEAFAVAHACSLAQVPFAVVLGVSHVVGPEGLHEWRQHERGATLAMAEVVATWIHNGAQGLPHG